MGNALYSFVCMADHILSLIFSICFKEIDLLFFFVCHPRKLAFERATF